MTSWGTPFSDAGRAYGSSGTMPTPPCMAGNRRCNNQQRQHMDLLANNTGSAPRLKPSYSALSPSYKREQERTCQVWWIRLCMYCVRSTSRGGCDAQNPSSASMRERPFSFREEPRLNTILPAFQRTDLFCSLTRPCLARGCYSCSSGCFKTTAADLSDGRGSKAGPPWWIATTSLALAGLPRCWRARDSSRPHLVWRAMAEPISPRSGPYPLGLRPAILSTVACQRRRAGATVQLAGPGVTPHAPQRRTALAAGPPGTKPEWRVGGGGGEGGGAPAQGGGAAMRSWLGHAAAPRRAQGSRPPPCTAHTHTLVAVYCTHTHTHSLSSLFLTCRD